MLTETGKLPISVPRDRMSTFDPQLIRLLADDGAKVWLRVMNELKSRDVEDLLIALVDGLKGFPDAVTAVFPQAQVQTCIVHLIRNAIDLCCGLTRPSATIPAHPTRTASLSQRLSRRSTEPRTPMPALRPQKPSPPANGQLSTRQSSWRGGVTGPR